MTVVCREGEKAVEFGCVGQKEKKADQNATQRVLSLLKFERG